MPQYGSVFLPRASATRCEGAAHRSQPIDVPVAPFLINLGTWVPLHIYIPPRPAAPHLSSTGQLCWACSTQPGPHRLVMVTSCPGPPQCHPWDPQHPGTPWGPPSPRRAVGCPPRAPADSRKPGLPCLSLNIYFLLFLPHLSPASLLSLLGLSSRWGCKLTQTLLLAWGLQSFSLSLSLPLASPHLTPASPNPHLPL